MLAMTSHCGLEKLTGTVTNIYNIYRTETYSPGKPRLDQTVLYWTETLISTAVTAHLIGEEIHRPIKSSVR